MKRSWLIPVLVLMGVSGLGALEDLTFPVFKNRYGVTAGLGVGFWLPFMEELVYGSGGALVSRVAWKVTPVAVIETGFILEPVDAFSRIGFSVRGRAVMGFPGKTGMVIDEDYEETGEQISYSEHNGERRYYFVGAGEIGLGVPLGKRWLIEGLWGIFWRNEGVEAYDGYIQGDSEVGYYEGMVAFNLYGTGISYEQNWLIFAPGLGGRFRYRENSIFRLVFYITPLQWGEHRDRHYFRSFDGYDENMKYLEFEDKPRFGLYFRLGFEWVYGLTDRLDVAGEFRYGKSVKAKGDTRISSTGYVRKREIVRDGGGAVFDETGVTLMIRIKL